MFIRRRGTSHQMMESYREDAKAKQRVIANLGSCTTVAEAKELWQHHVAVLAADLAMWERHLQAGLAFEAQFPVIPHAYKTPHGGFRKDGKRIIEREIARCQRRLAAEQANLERIKAIDDA